MTLAVKKQSNEQLITEVICAATKTSRVLRGLLLIHLTLHIIISNYLPSHLLFILFTTRVQVLIVAPTLEQGNMCSSLYPQDIAQFLAQNRNSINI